MGALGHLAGERAGREMSDYAGIPDLEIIKTPSVHCTYTTEEDYGTCRSRGEDSCPQEGPESRPRPWDVFAPSGRGLEEGHKHRYICAFPGRLPKPVKASSLARHWTPAVIPSDITLVRSGPPPML